MLEVVQQQRQDRHAFRYEDRRQDASEVGVAEVRESVADATPVLVDARQRLGGVARMVHRSLTQLEERCQLGRPSGVQDGHETS
jgi:hypothetical protein